MEWKNSDLLPRTINAPLRGAKGILVEGGLHLPFNLTWPGKIKGGSTDDHSITSLDLAPMSVELAGSSITPDDKIDGVNIFKFISGEGNGAPHQDLKWCFTISASICKGNWKLVRLPDRLHSYIT